MKKLRFWLIKKMIGNIPVIMNVTITVKGEIEIKGAEPEGIYEKMFVDIPKEEKVN